MKKIVNQIPDEQEVLIGDRDKFSRNDLDIEKIVTKKYEFDQDNSYYHVLVMKGLSEGCLLR